MFYTVDILFYLTYLVSIHSKSTTKIKHNTLYLKIFQIFTAAVLYFAVVHLVLIKSTCIVTHLIMVSRFVQKRLLYALNVNAWLLIYFTFLTVLIIVEYHTPNIVVKSTAMFQLM